MIRAVFDCSVIFSGIGWRGEAQRCLVLVARRRVGLFVTEIILQEYERVIPAELSKAAQQVNPMPKLAWIRTKSRLIEPAPLGKRRSRDAKDDPYLACALGADAEFIVTYDFDLLELEKPFGIKIVRPSAFLKQLAGT